MKNSQKTSAPQRLRLSQSNLRNPQGVKCGSIPPRRLLDRTIPYRFDGRHVGDRSVAPRRGKQSMRSLRKLWGFALAATAWALVMMCLLLPGRAEATVPQAPNQQSVLAISASGSGNTLNISGSLTASRQAAGEAEGVPA